MSEDYIREFEKSRRRLPHWEDPGATYFITFNLERPPVVDLTRPDIAALVVSALRHFDGDRYLLFVYTVMPDHVHCILKPAVQDGKSLRLAGVTHSIKSWLAHEINGRLNRTGTLWQDESQDHIIRSEEDFREKADYIFDNPRRKGLVHDPVDWPWRGTGTGQR